MQNQSRPVSFAKNVTAARGGVLDGALAVGKVRGMEAAGSARSALLFRGPAARDVAEGPGQLGGVEAGAGGGPVLGRQFEVAVARPVGHHADHVGQVRLGVEAMELAAGDEREEVGGGEAWSSLPKNNQAFLPVAMGLKARSEALLSMGSRPSSRKRRRAAPGRTA